MMKSLTRLTLAALAAALCTLTASAQPPSPQQSPAPTADTWVAVSPEGAGFAALMSKQPVAMEQRVTGGGMYVAGTRYAAAADERTTYIVWSLQNPDGVLWRRLSQADITGEGVSAASLYLDHVAELAYELLVAPEFKRFEREGAKPEDRGVYPALSYVRDLDLGGHRAREYAVTLEKERGPVYVCADGARIYVVAGLGAAATDPRLKLFAGSFTLGGKPSLPVPSTIHVDPALIKTDPRDIPYGLPNSTATAPPSAGPGRGGGMGTGTGLGPGSGGNTGGGGPGGAGPGGEVDYSRPFRQGEVTKKALITFKPEPGFTEWARKFHVTGVVRLRAVLHSSGTVQNISVVKTLPHGLTRKALDALKVVRFEPAQKDGRAVSQYAVFEYNFNIY